MFYNQYELPSLQKLKNRVLKFDQPYLHGLSELEVVGSILLVPTDSYMNKNFRKIQKNLQSFSRCCDH